MILVRVWIDSRTKVLEPKQEQVCTNMNSATGARATY